MRKIRYRLHVFAWLTLMLLLLLLLPGKLAAQSVGPIVYEGWWTNLTFGSFGQAYFKGTLQNTNFIIYFNLDGNVFGMPDPPPFTITNPIPNGFLVQIDQPGLGTLGDLKGTFNLITGGVALTNVNVPNPYIRQCVTLGTIANGVANLSYTVDFNDVPSPSNPAVGVIRARQTSPLQITRTQRSDSSILLEWVGGKPPFQISARTNLTSGDWVSVGGATPNFNTSVPLATSGQLFFRVAGQP